jgi:hypothetical protein
MHGADLEVKMCSNFKRAKKLVERWGLDLHMEPGDEGDDVVYCIKNTLYQSLDLNEIIEWINEEFEEK